MSADTLPLGAHPSFRVGTISQVAETVHNKLSATVVQAGGGRQRLDARGNVFDLPASSLWACSYGMPLRLRFPEGQPFRIQFRRRGAGEVRIQRNALAVDAAQSVIYAGGAEVDFGEDFEQVVWRAPPNLLVRKLAALTGSAVVKRLEIAPVLPLGTPQAQAMLRTLDALLMLSEAGTAAATKIMAGELENALLVGLLFSTQHNYRELLDRSAPAAAPWQVYRAESFMEANWDQSIRLEDIVAATGASARSLFRAFRQSRGYTPWQFLKQVRLLHAKRLLQDTEQDLSVTEIGLMCGFADLSSFSKEFSCAFGMPPSHERRRRANRQKGL